MRQLGAVVVAALSLAVPATAAADYPGERPWQDPAVTEPYMVAAGAALKRLYPTDERRCAAGIGVFLADDLGTAGDGTPATASGEARLGGALDQHRPPALPALPPRDRVAALQAVGARAAGTGGPRASPRPAVHPESHGATRPAGVEVILTGSAAGTAR